MTWARSLRGELSGIVTIIAGRLVQVALIIYSIRLLTNLLDPDELGRYYLFMSLVAFPGLVFINPVGQFLARKTNRWHHSGLLLARLFDYAVFAAVVVAVSSVALWIMLELGYFGSLNNLVFVFIFGLFVFFQTFSNLIPFIFNLLFQRLLFSFLTVLASLLMVVIPYSMAVDSGLSSDWLWGGVIALAVASLAGVLLLASTVAHQEKAVRLPVFSRKQLRALIRFSFPLSLATLFMWLQSAGLRVLVEHFFTLEYLAYLGVGLIISQQISMVAESVLSQIYHPVFFSRIEHGNPAERARTLGSILEITVPIYLAMLVFIVVFAREIFVLLVDERYRDAYIFLQVAIFFDFFRVLSNQYALVFHSELDTTRNVFPYVVGAVVTVVAVILGRHYSEAYYYLVPLVWSSGMFLTFLVMIKSTRLLLSVRFPFALAFKTIVLTGPLWGFLYVQPVGGENLSHILFEMASAVLYSLVISYFLLKERFMERFVRS